MTQRLLSLGVFLSELGKQYRLLGMRVRIPDEVIRDLERLGAFKNEKFDLNKILHALESEKSLNEKHAALDRHLRDLRITKEAMLRNIEDSKTNRERDLEFQVQKLEKENALLSKLAELRRDDKV